MPYEYYQHWIQDIFFGINNTNTAETKKKHSGKERKLSKTHVFSLVYCYFELLFFLMNYGYFWFKKKILMSSNSLKEFKFVNDGGFFSIKTLI